MKMALSVQVGLTTASVGTRFRTKEANGATRGYEVISIDPLKVGQVHGGSLKEVGEILGEWFDLGLGDGFPRYTGQVTQAPGGRRHSVS